jgi:hypothetical protein
LFAASQGSNMARPRKIAPDDRYTEESLNMDVESYPQPDDSEEGALQELGTTRMRDRFAALTEADFRGSDA